MGAFQKMIKKFIIFLLVVIIIFVGSLVFAGTYDYCEIYGTCQAVGLLTNVYGEAYNKEDAGFQDLDLVTTDVYVFVTNLTEGNSNGFSNGDGNLTAQVGGLYKASIILGGESAGNSEYGMKLFINSVGQSKCYHHVHFKTGDANGMVISCLISLSAGDVVNVGVDDHIGSPNDFLLKSFNINLIRIGERLK